MKIAHIDRAKYPPESESVYGASWRCLPPDNYAGDPHATVAFWIVFAPYAHQWWPYYRIALIHLRPTPGLSAATIYKLGATHEIVVEALSPDSAPLPLFERKQVPLLPSNFVGQFVVQQPNPVDADREAVEIVQRNVDAILRGELNPDSDGIRQWVALYGDDVMKQ